MRQQHPFIFDDNSETPLTTLTVHSGSLPLWLSGDLIRNGPGRFNFTKAHLNHWFDGMAVLHKFSFKDGQVEYFSKFLQSNAFLALVNKHQIDYGEFATSVKQSLLKNLYDLLRGKLTDNNNVNIIKFGNHYLAMTETDRHVLIDPLTLLINKSTVYNDNIKYTLNLAHPIIDETSQQLYNLGIKFGRTSIYSLYQTDLTTGKRKIIAQIPTKEPSYMHTFAKTENYFILYENPLKLKLLSLFFANKPFIENYVWTNEPVKFTVIDKNGKIILQIQHESFFCFHLVNAFEENNKIHLDLIVYPNADIIKAFYLTPRVNLNSPDLIPRLRRYTIDLKNNSCTSYAVKSPSIEFPAINNQYAQKSNTYIYATANKNNQFARNSLVKIDLSDPDQHKYWQQEGCYPGEPVLVAKPDSIAEDDGIIMSVVTDPTLGISFLLMLDAMTFNEVARINLPHSLPLGLHGAFYPQ